MPDMKVRSRRWYYLFAAAVYAAGMAGTVLLLFCGISSHIGGLTQMVVPGQHELILSETGRYMVFHEYRSVVGNTSYSMAPGGLSGLQCTLSSKATGEQIPLSLSRSTMKARYSMGSRAGVLLLDFRVISPGTYVFSAQYPAGQEGASGVLSVGHGYVKQVLVIILGCLAIMYCTTVGATAIAKTSRLKSTVKAGKMNDGPESIQSITWQGDMCFGILSTQGNSTRLTASPIHLVLDGSLGKRFELHSTQVEKIETGKWSWWFLKGLKSGCIQIQHNVDGVPEKLLFSARKTHSKEVAEELKKLGYKVS
jgi:hypothetical protein